MDNKLCSLTFDDGPNLTTTVRTLDALAFHGVAASFFIVGNLVGAETRKVAERALAMGCDLQNHSWTHTAMATMDARAIGDEIARTSELIREISGVSPAFFRPPYISVNETVYAAIDEAGLVAICGINGLDWEARIPARERAERILADAEDGSIILLHDFEGNEATVEALGILIPALRERGFSFATVGELFRAKGVSPRARGTLWSRVP